jgi:2,3-bisphosphoglycerate-independent phosphoglycerate mutase
MDVVFEGENKQAQFEENDPHKETRQRIRETRLEEMVHFSRCVKSLVESGAPCFALQECISSWC